MRYILGLTEKPANRGGFSEGLYQLTILKYMKAKLFVCVSLCAAMGLSSCSSLSDSALARLQGTGIGVLGGGGIGAGIGAIAGGKKGAAIGAGIGALVGGLAGYAWGASVAKEKNEYDRTEDYIRAHIDQLDSRVDDAEETNEKLEKQIASMRKENSRLSAQEYNALRNQLNSNIDTVDKDLAAANRAAKYATGEDLEELREKRTELMAQRDALNANLSTLKTLQARR